VLPKPPWILLRSVLGQFKTDQLSSNDGLGRVVVILCYNPIVHKVIPAASTDPTVAGPRSSMTVIELKSSKQSPTGNTSTGIVRGCETDVVVSPSLVLFKKKSRAEQHQLIHSSAMKVQEMVQVWDSSWT
jgi:hypothetical protein